MTYHGQLTAGVPDWQSTADFDTLKTRALMLQNIRAFFHARGVTEVETPLLSHYAATDLHLDSLRAAFRDQSCYLNTSPEYAMKRLLAQWQQPIYQVCKAFRDDELGLNHNPEFTLLEWYQPNYNMMQLMTELTELISMLCAASSITPVFESLSYQQAFENSVGFNPHQISAAECHSYALSNAVEIPQGLTATDDVNHWLDWLLMQRVAPVFNKSGFTFLYDYPVAQCALAKIEDNVQQLAVAKRFELFFAELELANGFYELTDAAEQRRRFQLDNQQRAQAGKAVAKMDENLLAALAHGLPDCSGVAVGLDRLLMVLLGLKNIDQVLSFSWSRV